MTTEIITWTPVERGLPDADMTVLIEVHEDEDYSEPVFLGYHDGETWRDVHGEPLHVVAWADLPQGICQIARAAKESHHMPVGTKLRQVREDSQGLGEPGRLSPSFGENHP